ncbi:MAG TPA: DsbA family protein [Thermoplasmata archaeon]|nr:DsbA family protein [Thermoplasmata archaeon]
MPGTYTPPRLTLPVAARDHSQGASGADVVLVEYGDYQCPYCGAAYPVVKRVQQELGSSLRFVFRNFPITNSHPRAEWAAETAEAAAAQGKFWEMHDLLYEHQASLGDGAQILRTATSLGVDPKRIAREVEERLYRPRVEEDYLSGIRSGVNGTPTFFINGARYDGPAEFGALVAALKPTPRSTRR